MNHFFTSDLHFWHKNIIKYCNRPYASAEEMNEALIQNWNEDVKPSDKITILGDVFFCKPDVAVHIMSRLNGWKQLVLGNHDKVIKKNPELMVMFDEVLPDLHFTELYGQKVWMSHYPMMAWDSSSGAFMLHGHSHNTIPFDPKLRRLDVGVDAQGMRPVSWEAIKEKLLAVSITRRY